MEVDRKLTINGPEVIPFSSLRTIAVIALAISSYGDDGGGGGSPHVHDDPDDPDFPDDQLEHPSPEHFHNRLVMNEALLDPNDYQVKLIYVLCLPIGFHGP